VSSARFKPPCCAPSSLPPYANPNPRLLTAATAGGWSLQASRTSWGDGLARHTRCVCVREREVVRRCGRYAASVSIASPSVPPEGRSLRLWTVHGKQKGYLLPNHTQPLSLLQVPGVISLSADCTKEDATSMPLPFRRWMHTTTQRDASSVTNPSVGPTPTHGQATLDYPIEGNVTGEREVRMRPDLSPSAGTLRWVWRPPPVSSWGVEAATDCDAAPSRRGERRGAGRMHLPRSLHCGYEPRCCSLLS
jgi:hypothetical protein